MWFAHAVATPAASIQPSNAAIKTGAESIGIGSWSW
jgi:hypothetical protein